MTSFRTVASLALAATIASALPAAARDWPQAKGWTIIEDADTCALFMEYDDKGATQLTVVLYLDGSALAGVTNSYWSVEHEKAYDVVWALNDAEYSGATYGIVQPDGRKGFIGGLGQDFINGLGNNAELSVYVAKARVARLSLDGGAAALGVANDCLQAVRRDKEPSER